MNETNYIDKFTNNLENLLKQRLEREEYLKNLPKSINLSQSSFVGNIKQKYLNQNLVLVLGAGVSTSCGIPNWNKLLQLLLSKSFEEDTGVSEVYADIFDSVFKPNNIITGRYLSNYFSDKNFESFVRKSLYPKNLTKSKLISEIAKFCTFKKNSAQLNSIVSYNYDDILEENIRLEDNPLSFKPIFSEYESQNNIELLIFHVHGFLPQKGKLSPHNRIVLGENSYHSQYADIYSWQNVVQLNKFRDTTCLFIGSSLTDPNLRRLLDIANHKVRRKNCHYIIKTRHDFDLIKNKLESFLNDDLSNPLHKLISRLDTAGTTKFLIDTIEKFEEQDALSFNIKTLWVDDHDEIPKILRKINEL